MTDRPPWGPICAVCELYAEGSCRNCPSRPRAAVLAARRFVWRWRLTISWVTLVAGYAIWPFVHWLP